MTEPTDSPRASSKRRRPQAQLVLIFAAIGALLVLLISVALNWGNDAGDTLDPPALFEVEPATCLNWTAADAHDIHEVPCSQPYVFQVTGKADLAANFGEEAPYPDAQRWQQIKQDRCTTVASRFLSKGLDPNGRLAVGAFTPSREAWDSGERTLQCGLQQPAPSGKLYRLDGNTREIDQSNTYSPGRCLGINGTAVWDPVDCAQPHSVEITGTVNLGEQFPQRFPSIEQQDSFLSTRCGELTARYAGGPTVAKDKGLVAYWDTLPKESWDTGSRQVNCKVSAHLPDGSGLAPVTGSVREEVRVSKKPAPEKPVPAKSGAPAKQSR